MNTLRRPLPVLLGCFPLLLLASAAHASLYTNQIGPNISYTNISEFDSQIIGPPPVNSNPTGLFGQPILDPAGSDNLSFAANTFDVLVADGQYEMQDGKLTLDITPTSPTGTLDSLTFDEGGGWKVLGDAAVEASLIFSDLQITSVDGVALATPIVVTPTFLEAITPHAELGGTPSTITAPGDVEIGSSTGVALGTWDISATFDLDAALADAEVTGSVTGVSVALDNQLLGDTDPDVESALNLGEIDKKHIIISGATTTDSGPVVPEPASVSVSVLVGCAGLAMRRRKAVV